MASASTLPWIWDAFLNFYGRDTRNGFTSHLYSVLDSVGIRTLRDDFELSSGEVISEALSSAIRQSNTYVAVFSENYASSRWCLDELVEILECCKIMGRLFIPVFYNIEPSAVRRQSGSFNDAFQRHVARYEMDRVINWRSALSEAANYSGFFVDRERSEADVIQEIASYLSIRNNIYPLTSDVSSSLVGIVSRLKHLTNMVRSTATLGVTRIGMYGKGGVGKTTLAKCLYDQNFHHFQGSCFLATVGEVSRHPYGRKRLQEQLIADVLKVKEILVGNVDQGTELIKDKISSLKVLVVIDDIEQQDQYESLKGPFAPGSVIVITTRDEKLLDTIQVDLKYEVNELDAAESLELFGRFAFRDTKPSDKLMELAKKVVRHIGGIPLVLKVLGQVFSKQTGVKDWTLEFEKLEEKHTLIEMLEIGFDDLKPADLKNIFLDIACFFTGNVREDVVKILKTCYQNADNEINILSNRSLITISDENEIEMHDLLRDVGRKNFRLNSQQEPGKFSRLWQFDNIPDVLNANGGKEAITGIILDGRPDAFLSARTFRGMHQLKLMYLKHVAIVGNFEGTFVDLRWLRWSNCPLEVLPSDFYPQRLVILEMPHSRIEIWNLTMVLERLTVLDLSHSGDLTTTPDFTKLPSLETLNLQSCVSLEKIDESVGSLSQLVSLDLNNCLNLRSLPATFGNLSSLESLDIRGCRSLRALPGGLKSIKSLKEFKAFGHNISELPNSKGDLAKLVNLFR